MASMLRSDAASRVQAAVLGLGALASLAIGAGMASAFDVTAVESSVYRIYAFPSGGSGSGFLVSGKRTVVTNFHVIEKDKEFFIAFRDANRQGQLVPARVTAGKPNLDLAILEADRDLPGKALTLGDYEPEKLANVVTVGFPGAADIREKPRSVDEFMTRLKDPSALDATMTAGAVSRMNSAEIKKSETRTLNARTVQHNAQFNPGNSGGPLFDDCNAVVGINTFFRTDAQGVFFSIHSGELIRTLRELSVGFASTNSCHIQPSMMMPVVIGLSVTLALAALVLALRSGSLEQVSVQLSRMTGMRRLRNTGSIDPRAPIPLLAAPVPGAALSLQSVASGRGYPLDSGRMTMVGRGRSCDISIEDDTVSSSHAHVQFNAQTQRLAISDLGSSNGTFVNGARITTGQAGTGDTVRFGMAEFRVTAGAVPATSVVSGRSSPASTPARGAWMLSGFDPSGRALQFELRPKSRESGNGSASWTIGRDSARAQFVIDDSSVSGAHAQINYAPSQGLSLRDLGSTNGTQVDGQPTGTREVPLKEAGQEITFGAAKLRLSRLIA